MSGCAYAEAGWVLVYLVVSLKRPFGSQIICGDKES